MQKTCCLLFFAATACVAVGGALGAAYGALSGYTGAKILNNSFPGNSYADVAASTKANAIGSGGLSALIAFCNLPSLLLLSGNSDSSSDSKPGVLLLILEYAVAMELGGLLGWYYQEKNGQEVLQLEQQAAASAVGAVISSIPLTISVFILLCCCGATCYALQKLISNANPSQHTSVTVKSKLTDYNGEGYAAIWGKIVEEGRYDPDNLILPGTRAANN